MQSGHGKAGPSKWQRGAPAGGDVSRMLRPGPRLESDSRGTWEVRFIPADSAVKVYTCPGCSRPIPAGVAHLVVLQADSIFGDAYAVSERRHWHQRCWRARPA